MKKLQFFTTQGCHLCEQAEEMLVFLQERYVFKLVVIDIATDQQLMEKYGLSIPVLLNTQSNEHICWPFNADKIMSLLNS